MNRFGRFLLIFLTSAALLTVAICFLESSNQSPAHEGNEPVEGISSEADSIRNIPPADNESELEFEQEKDEPASTSLQNNSVFGYVVSEETGEPVENATVRVIYNYREHCKGIEPTCLPATTNNKGLFRVENIPCDISILYQVEAVSYGVYSEQTSLGSKADERELGPVELVGGTNVTFTITDSATGKPLSGEGLWMWDSDSCQLIYGAYTKQNDDGSITLRLQPGEYTIFTDRLQYAPGKKESVKVGEDELTVDFSLTPGEDISGIVLDHEGNPSASARVDFETLEGRNVGAFICDNNGRFTAYSSLKKGLYNLIVDAKESFGYTTKNVSSGTKDLTIRLQGTIFLNGSLIDDETGGPIFPKAACVWMHFQNQGYDGCGAMTRSDNNSSYLLKVPEDLKYIYVNVGSCIYEDITEQKVVLPVTIGNCFTYDIRVKRLRCLVGKITESDMKRPLSNVDVTLTCVINENKSKIKTTTGENGTYGFRVYPNMKGGIVGIHCSRNGFISYTNNSYNLGYTTDLSAHNVELRRAGKITGTVTGRDGSPLPGIIVRDKFTWPQRKIGNRCFLSHTTTDKSGNYTLESLDPVATHIISTDGSKRLISRKRKVRVSAGKTTTFNIVMFNRSEISGRVISQTGELAAEAKIELTIVEAIQDNKGWVSGDSRKFNVKSDANGFYKFEKLPPGTCTFKVTARGYLDYKWAGLGLGEEELKKNTDLELDPGLSVAGIVLDNFNHPIAGAKVHLSPNKGHGQRTKTDENGHFRFTTLKEGYVRLYASAHGYIGNPNRRVHAGTHDVCFNLILGGTLTGKVTGLDTFSDTCISASPEGPGCGASSHSNADGSFVLQLHPGKYTVKVTGKGFIGKIMKGIEIEAGKNMSITVPVLSGCAQTVKVLDADGFQPIQGAGVYFKPYAASQEERQKLPWNIRYNNHKRTDSSGLATYSGLMPGTYMLEVGQTNYHKKTVGIVHVSDGPGESREVLLQKLGSIEIKIELSGRDTRTRYYTRVLSIDDEKARIGSKYNSSIRIRKGDSRTFHNVPKGLYRIIIRESGQNSYMQTVYVTRGENVTCIFQF